MRNDDSGDWRERRQRAVAAHRAEDDRQRRRDQAEAAELIAWFAAEARRLDLPTVRLTATGYDGRARYRTPLSGWYLDQAKLRAVTPDGLFYLLMVPAGLRARLFGARPQPEPAPLILNRGGRDGESLPLRALLRRRLATGADAG